MVGEESKWSYDYLSRLQFRIFMDVVRTCKNHLRRTQRHTGIHHSKDVRSIRGTYWCTKTHARSSIFYSSITIIKIFLILPRKLRSFTYGHTLCPWWVFCVLDIQEYIYCSVHQEQLCKRYIHQISQGCQQRICNLQKKKQSISHYISASQIGFWRFQVFLVWLCL